MLLSSNTEYIKYLLSPKVMAKLGPVVQFKICDKNKRVFDTVLGKYLTI